MIDYLFIAVCLVLWSEVVQMLFWCGRSIGQMVGQCFFADYEVD